MSIWLVGVVGVGGWVGRINHNIALISTAIKCKLEGQLRTKGMQFDLNVMDQSDCIKL